MERFIYRCTSTDEYLCSTRRFFISHASQAWKAGNINFHRTIYDSMRFPCLLVEPSEYTDSENFIYWFTLFFFLSFKFLKNLIEVDVYVYYIMLENLKKENFSSPFMKFEKTNFFLISIPHFNSLSFLSIVTAWTSIFLGLNQQNELTKNTLTLTNKIQRMDNYHSRSNGFSSRVRTLSGEKKRL